MVKFVPQTFKDSKETTPYKIPTRTGKKFLLFLNCNIYQKVKYEHLIKD